MAKKKLDRIHGKVYQQFSRQRYNSYKHKYPKMSELIIVDKLIQEWKLLDIQTKNNLKRRYQEEGIIDDYSNASDQQSDEEESFKQKRNKIKIGKDKERTAIRHSEDSESQMEVQLPVVKAENHQDLVKKEPDAIVKNQQERDQKFKKSKKIEKPSKPKSQYIQFYKYYYQKLWKEHPYWKSIQFTKIISLLWKKRNQNKKKLTQTKIKTKKQGKRRNLSGYQLFKKKKNSQSNESYRQIWKHMPIEARSFYIEEARKYSHYENEIIPAKKRLVVKLKSTSNPSYTAQESSHKIFQFMNKTIDSSE